ncbi:MAG TPA: metallophosphoesterase [Candidatus Methylomirabilis sp.]|nr:metallophosphoesterase [Candidatus Methylomirabilis sp.]
MRVKRPGCSIPRTLASLIGVALSLATSQGALEAQPLLGGRSLGRAPALPPPSALPIVFTELGPTGLIARAVTADTTCPEIELDGNAQSMQVRAVSAPPDFPILVCETAVPASIHHAVVGQQELPLFKPNPTRIVVIGDAGCRIEGSDAQACNDPLAWPFADVAKQAALVRPDLVIHVGDYIYREDPCPSGDLGCAGSPFGENWETLQADLFTPAQPLLQAAPWVFVRGNHEICSRGGEAWFRVLSPLPMPPICVDYTDPYKISLGNVDLLILDSAITDDTSIPPDQVAAFKVQFDVLREMVTGDSWLVTHKPLYVFGNAGEQNGVEQLFIDQQVLQTASGNDFPLDIRLFIGGHVHLFETLSFGFGNGRPPQLVAGISGTELSAAVTTPLTGLEMAGLEVTSGTTEHQFGFVVMQKGTTQWTATLRGVDGVPRLGCRLEPESLECVGFNHPGLVK